PPAPLLAALQRHVGGLPDRVQERQPHAAARPPHHPVLDRHHQRAGASASQPDHASRYGPACCCLFFHCSSNECFISDSFPTHSHDAFASNFCTAHRSQMQQHFCAPQRRHDNTVSALDVCARLPLVVRASALRTVRASSVECGAV